MSRVWRESYWKPCGRSWYRKQFRRKCDFAAKMRENPTASESAAWQIFQSLNYHYPDFIWKRQRVKYGYVVDFFCQRLNVAVEIDGITHFGKEEEDRQRDANLGKRGIRVLRFSGSLVINDPKRFLELLKKEIET